MYRKVVGAFLVFTYLIGWALIILGMYEYISDLLNHTTTPLSVAHFSLLLIAGSVCVCSSISTVCEIKRKIHPGMALFIISFVYMREILDYHMGVAVLGWMVLLTTSALMFAFPREMP